MKNIAEFEKKIHFFDLVVFVPVFLVLFLASVVFRNLSSNFFFFFLGGPSINSFSNSFFSGESGLRRTFFDFGLPGLDFELENNLIC